MNPNGERLVPVRAGGKMKLDYTELRRLLAEAPGKQWWWVGARYPTDIHVTAEIMYGPIVTPNTTTTECLHTSALIVAMRNALPGLLAEAEAGRKLRREVEWLYIDRNDHCCDGYAVRCPAHVMCADYDREVGT